MFLAKSLVDDLNFLLYFCLRPILNGVFGAIHFETEILICVPICLEIEVAQRLILCLETLVEASNGRVVERNLVYLAYS